jgi:uncharacterized protein (TIGR03435 family)
MKMAGKMLLFIAAVTFAVAPLLSQTKPQTTSPKASFEVVSIKPSPPNLNIRGGGPRGDRLNFTGGALRMLLQQAYARPNPAGGAGLLQIQIIGGPSWIDSDLYDINAKADCAGGPISREQMQLMIQSMLEDRFQLKAHTETRELPVYHLVVGRDGPKIKPSADQTPPPFTQAGPPQLCGPAPPPVALPAPLPPPPPPGVGGPPSTPPPPPRGSLRMMMGPAAMTMQGSATPFANFVNMLSQFSGRPVVDKTDLKGLFDFTLQFSREGLTLPGMPPGAPPPGPGLGPGGPGGPIDQAADPVPSLFTAIQELGLRLESTKGPVDVLVVDSVEKPTEN